MPHDVRQAVLRPVVARASQARVMSLEHFDVDGAPLDAGELVRLGRRFALVGERAVWCVQRFDSRATWSSIAAGWASDAVVSDDQALAAHAALPQQSLLRRVGAT
jgi:hypothetical protein